ncbi:MAG: sulfotransferase domain-containing protein [Planctomycetota bacterium]|jgi:hypothetical protein
MSKDIEFTEAYVATKKEVFTAGFPRSGNTWLDRLLSDMLKAPLQTLPNEVIEYFGPDPHDGDYVVRKTHWYAKEYSGVGYHGQPSKLIWIIRDPRDMIVSMMFYRNVQPDLIGVMDSALFNKPHGVLEEHGYPTFVDGWLRAQTFDYMTRYELLHSQPFEELQNIAKAITGDTLPDDWVKGVIHRQRFDRWAPRYEHSMRKGVAGDWENHFKREDGKYITDAIGHMMFSQGYIDDLDWWKELPE